MTDVSHTFRGDLARRYPVAGFFLLAYLLSWGEVLALGMGLHLPSAVVVALTTLAPTLAALIMIAAIDGRRGLGSWFRSILARRAGPLVYLSALVGIPLALLLGTLAVPGAAASFAPDSPTHWIVAYLIVFVAGGIAGGPLFEEPGWRGFALPRLEARFGPLGGTLILGVLWGAWHLPQLLIPEWAAQNGGVQPLNIAIFLITVVAIAVILTFVYNRSNGSLLLVVLAHASVNTAQMTINALFPAAGANDANGLIGFGALALVLIAVTRGRLGYRPAQLS